MPRPKLKPEDKLVHLVPVRFTKKEFVQVSHLSKEILHSKHIATFIHDVIISYVTKGLENLDQRGIKSSNKKWS